MAEMSATSARVRGVFILLCGLPLLALGGWLYLVVLGRPIPAWVPAAFQNPPELNLPGLVTDRDRLTSLPGLASLFLLAFGGAAALQGLFMLATGRRSRALLVVLAAGFLVMIGFGLWVAQGG